MADEVKCPICELELSQLTRPEAKGARHFFCEECNIEFYRYIGSHKEGVWVTGWYAHIPLRSFPRDIWQEFLCEDIPDAYAHLHREWQKKVG